MKVHFPAQQLREFLFVSKKSQPGVFCRQKLDQHIDVAAARLKVVARGRSEQAQFPDCTLPAKTRDRFSINIDGESLHSASLNFFTTNNSLPLSSITFTAICFCSPATNGSLVVPARCSHTLSA